MATSPFAKLALSPPVLRAVVEEGYLEPTPVQLVVVPPAVEGRDVLACAQTGTGKTAAFVLPILERLSRGGPDSNRIRALVLTPTRELALQIAERVSAYGKYLGFRHAIVYGGVSQKRQEMALRERPQILVATPGRLLDLIGQGLVDLGAVDHLVLDEVDRMLDIGFARDVGRITAALPKRRQTLLFSATVPPAIAALARTLLHDPVRVTLTPKTPAAPSVEQSLIFVSQADKLALLRGLLEDSAVLRAIVFTRTKRGANRLAAQLERAGIGSAAIHGNKSQAARERALRVFQSGGTRVLVATDVAARGIDIDDVSHVINYDMPIEAESYVHRIGRTGRAGASGRAISLCDRGERRLLADIERLIRRPIAVLAPHGPRSEQTPRVPLYSAAGRGRMNPSETGAPTARPLPGGSTFPCVRGASRG